MSPIFRNIPNNCAMNWAEFVEPKFPSECPFGSETSQAVSLPRLLSTTGIPKRLTSEAFIYKIQHSSCIRVIRGKCTNARRNSNFVGMEGERAPASSKCTITSPPRSPGMSGTESFRHSAPPFLPFFYSPDRHPGFSPRESPTCLSTFNCY